MNCIVAHKNLDDFDPGVIRAAWDKRRRSPLSWRKIRSKYGVSVETTDGKKVSGKFIVVLTVSEFDQWRARHA